MFPADSQTLTLFLLRANVHALSLQFTLMPNVSKLPPVGDKSAVLHQHVTYSQSPQEGVFPSGILPQAPRPTAGKTSKVRRNCYFSFSARCLKHMKLLQWRAFIYTFITMTCWQGWWTTWGRTRTLVPPNKMDQGGEKKKKKKMMTFLINQLAAQRMKYQKCWAL